MDTAFILAKQTCIMFALVLFGVFLFKKGMFTKRGGKQLSDFVIGAVCPVLIFTSFQKDFNEELAQGLLKAFFMSLASHAVFIAISMVFTHKKRGAEYAVERYAAVYSNCAFLGIPLVNAVYGSEGVFYITAYIAVFNLLSWTHGVMTMSGDFRVKGLLKALRSPAVIATAAGMVMFFSRIRLPEIVTEPLNYIASLNTPLAMLVSGIMIAQSDIMAALKKSGVYLVCGVRLLSPLAVIPVLMLFGADESVTNTVAIAASAPVGASTVMFANKYSRDRVYAAELFAVSSLFSVITMPLMLMYSRVLYSLA